MPAVALGSLRASIQNWGWVSLPGSLLPNIADAESGRDGEVFQQAVKRPDFHGFGLSLTNWREQPHQQGNQDLFHKEELKNGGNWKIGGFVGIYRDTLDFSAITFSQVCSCNSVSMCLWTEISAFFTMT